MMVTYTSCYSHAALISFFCNSQHERAKEYIPKVGDCNNGKKTIVINCKTFVALNMKSVEMKYDTMKYKHHFTYVACYHYLPNYTSKIKLII